MKNGYGTYTFEDGTKYEGEYKEDKRTGKGYFVFSNGKIQFDDN